jgi:outer membrane protein TolC
MLSKLARLALPMVAALALPWLASAQAAKTPAQPAKPPARVAGAAPAPPASPAASQPPVIEFDPKGLTLLDAVRLTLEHDPNVKLKDADLDRRTGVRREQAGAFDMTLAGTGDYNYSRTQLTDTTKYNLQQQRDQLDQGIQAGQSLYNDLSQAVGYFNNLVGTSPTGAVPTVPTVTNPDLQLELNNLQQQLTLIQDTMNTVANPAVKGDLVGLWQSTVNAAQSRFNTALGATNAALYGTPAQNGQPAQPGAIQLRQDLGDTPQDQWNKSADVRLDFKRPTRSGITLDPFLSFNYTDSNYVGKDSWDPNYGGLGTKPYYKTEIGFDLTVPLMRGRGRDDAAAAETAAIRDVESARFDLIHQRAVSVLNTVLAYWEARAAFEAVGVAQRSVDIQTQLGDLTQKLAAAGERAKTDVTRSQAALADSQGNLEAAQRRLAEARVSLATVMGVAVGDAGSIPLAGDPFPRPGSFTADAAAVAELTRQALGLRADQLSALKVEEEDKVLARGALLETRRKLDLQLEGSGNSGSEDAPNMHNWIFRSGSVGLDLEVPFSNNQALGRHDQAGAQQHEATITQTDLGRTIALNIHQAVESLRLAAERVKWAEDAALAYEQTIADEQVRLRNGDSTLIDTILTEQQTTAARSAFVQALQDYASLLARLRFESGTLIRDVNGQASVPLENLITLPLALQKASQAR